MFIFWGTVSQWTITDQGLISNFTTTFAPTRMVHRHEHWWLSLTRHYEVPVIALFTKYDQFLFNVEMDVWDDPDKYPGEVSEEAEKRFQEHYLRPLGDKARYVRLESEVQTYKLGLRLNVFIGRNAYERWLLQWSYWRDGCGAGWGCCCINASSCAKGEFRIECQNSFEPVSVVHLSKR